MFNETPSKVVSHSTNFELYHAECKPGTYSHTGLEPCNPCEKGTYSDVGGATSCKPCPDCSYTTSGLQTQSSTDCKKTLLCDPGTYSDSGNKPCKPCSIHHFTNLSGSLKCEACPFTNATWNTGSTSCKDPIFSPDYRLKRNSSFPFVQYVPVGSTDNLHYEQAYIHLDGKKVIFQPNSGSIKASLGIHTVEVASTDKVLAPVSFRFHIDVRPISSCEPTKNIPNSKNAQILCRKPDPAGNGYECTFTCNHGFAFSDYTKKKTFKCAPGQDWKRDVYIQDCAAIMRGYRIESNQTFRFSDKIHSTCIQAVKYKRMKVISNLTDVCLEKYPHMKDMKIESVIFVENRVSENTLVIGTVTDISSLGTVSYTECFKLIKEVLRKGEDSIDHCPTQMQPVTLNTSQTTFPCTNNTYIRRNSATSLDECVFCSSGSFLNKTSSRCDICPNGTYQDEVGSTSCKKCPSGTWTYNTGSKSFDDCIVQCDQHGMINSTNGLPPCRQCRELSFSYSPGDPTTCRFCGHITAKKVFCPGDFGWDWCFQCDILGTADCNKNNRDAPCVCRPNYSGKFCEINLRKSACESSPCENGGRCFISHLEQERGYKCFCPAGYEGANCEMNVDDCTATSCLHGACLDGNGTYSCHCDQGFKGERCEVPIDECYSLPCVNGFCESRVNGFYCNCFGTPFTGKFCNETLHNKMTCEPSICLNGGKCVTFATNSTFKKCDCKNGTHGKYCETVDSPCKPNNPCKNGGLCVQESYDSFKCVCKHGSGFTGTLCELRKTPCSPNPCNKGTCEIDGSSYRCLCPLVSGRRVYYGHNCEKVNQCADNPCKYGKCVAHGLGWKCNCTLGFQGAHCNETVDTCSIKTSNGQLPCEPSSTKNCINTVTKNKPDFFCHCKEGWEGKNCAKDIDECTKATNPCQNNGTCFNTPGHFGCNCTLGAPLWEGELCDVLKKDPCTPPGPCKNGGNCTRTADGFLCSCPVEWKGKTCEEDVNECQAAFPCQHGTCTNTTGGFSCSCFKGYEGKRCSIMIDMCKSSPCLNNGDCTSFLNGYNCTCPDEYTGKNCETAIDDCAPSKAGANPCGENGSCVDGWNSYSCRCNYNYTGLKCHKGKLPNFDLVFRGFNSTSYYTRNVSLTDSMSVEFWVRFANYQGKETFLTMALEDLGTSSKRDVLAYNGEGVTLSMFSETRLVKDPVNNADWKYVVLVIGGGKLMMYQNGQKKLEESQSFLGLKGRLHVTLGTPASRKTRHGFTGEISRLNIYKRALPVSKVNAVVDKCSEHSRAGDVFSWLMFDSKMTNVERVEPSICGTSNCSDGFKGSNCTIQIDSVPPEVAFCPGNIIAVNATNRLSQIKWPQPEFTDNVGIAKITANHRIGEVFAYGEYPIIYVAYDGEGNSAICQFKIFVLDKHCPEPDPPFNGIVAYGSLPWVKFAQIACKNILFAFSLPPPPFYTCLADGEWSPNKALNQPLVFPSCSEKFPAILRLIFGWLKIPIDECTDNRKRTLNSTMNMIINSLDVTYDICDGPCMPDIKVECGGVQTSGRRRKRQTIDDKITALLSYDLPNIKLNGSSIKLDTGDISSLLDTLLKMIKEHLASRNTSGLENNELEDISIDTTPICPKGSVLGLDKKCANCSRGTFYEMIKPQLAVCVNCPRGYYQDQEAQTTCKPCGSIGEFTTLAEGSHDVSQCYPYCPPGNYYSYEDRACVKCRLGYFQDNYGMFSCLSCAKGQTTITTGANSKSKCTAVCPLGTELATDGRCKECPLGTYRSQLKQTACLQCPYTDSTIYLTANTGATSEKMCSVVTCQRGHYRTTDGCYPCHLGMYQPAVTTNTSCIRCPKGMTTASERATSADDCQPGPVDECLFESHDCDVNGVCTDTADSFLCACKPGYVGDGRECQLVSQCGIGTCLNGGTCRASIGTTHCNCPHTHSGERCEKPSVIIIAISCVSAGIGVLFIAVLTWICVLKSRRKKTPRRTTPTSPYQRNWQNVQITGNSEFVDNPAFDDQGLGDPTENDSEHRPLAVRPPQFVNPVFKMQLDCKDGPEAGQRRPPKNHDEYSFE